MDPDVVVTGGRVALRRWRSSDVDEVAGVCQDPDIQRWTAVPVPYTRQDAVDFVTGVAVEQWRDVARVELEVEVANAASRGVAAGAGFTEEGTLRQRVLHRGRRIDVVMCSLLRTDPAASGPAPARRSA